MRLAHNTPWSNGFVYSFSVIGSAGLLVWVLTDTGWVRRLLSSAPLRYLGEISYTMYLVHMPVLELVLHRFGFNRRSQLLGLLFVVLYASISWFAMERPLLRFAARRTSFVPRLAPAG